MFADILLLLSIILYLVLCPYTKVEESFNMQAIHDLLTIPLSLDSFDHLEFPGVVPRTFLGSIAVASASFPFHYILHNICNVSKLYSQYLCRGTLGIFCWDAFVNFRRGVAARFGERVGLWTILLTAFSFHLPFYMSRTLPNTFALIGCLHAYSCWLRGLPTSALVLIAATMVVFRCELLVLLAPLTLQLLLAREVPLLRTALLGVGSSLLALMLTVAVDTYFWRQVLWPEGMVLFFNTVQNKSSHWGTLPWHWYFTNALPKSLHVCVPLGLYGALGGTALRVRPEAVRSGPLVTLVVAPHAKLCYYVLPALAYVALYSWLPHKELRFVFPALPLFTMAAAVGVDKILPALVPSPVTVQERNEDDFRPEVCGALKLAAAHDHPPAPTSVPSTTRAFLHFTLRACVCGLLALSAVVSAVFVCASRLNYPGGQALQRLLEAHIPNQPNIALSSGSSSTGNITGSSSSNGSSGSAVRVHIDVAAAMTGVTRFGQLPSVRRRQSSPSCSSSGSSGSSGSSSRSSSANKVGNDEHRSSSSSERGDCVSASSRGSDSGSDSDSGVVRVEYSKQEGLQAFDSFDWLLTDDDRYVCSSCLSGLPHRLSALHLYLPV